MRKDFKKLFSYIEPVDPPAGIFDRIIAAIRKEQELQKTKRLAMSFFLLLVISLVTTSLSWALLVNQAKSTGISYFLSMAISDFGVFIILWKDFSMAIIESLPIIGLTAFLFSTGLAIFTLRLFLFKKRLLLKYLMHGTNIINVY